MPFYGKYPETYAVERLSYAVHGQAVFHIIPQGEGYLLQRRLRDEGDAIILFMCLALRQGHQSVPVFHMQPEADKVPAVPFRAAGTPGGAGYGIP